MVIFVRVPIRHIKSGTDLSIHQTVHQTGIQERHSRNIPSLKLISFLQPPVYPLQIPKPPSVMLTNEAIKFRVSNSFELHLLSESFNIPTVGSQSSSGLFSTSGFLFNRDHQLTLFCHSFLEGERKARQREMNISASEIPPVSDFFFFFFVRGKFPMCFQKRDQRSGCACSNSPALSSHLIPSPAYVFSRLALDQVDCDPISN